MTLRRNAARPGRQWLTLAAGTIALMAAAVTVALAISDTGTHNLIVETKDDPIKEVDIGNALVAYIPSAGDDQSSGTGLFDPFVRLQGSPTQNGYNTNGAVQFDTKAGQWTKAIKASAIPVVPCVVDEDPTTTETCWELFVDINEGNNAKYVSLTRVEIWFADSPTLVGYNEATHTFTSGAALKYEFSGEIQIHDVNQGSGRGDLRYLVPVQSFTANDWFVLYSEWGSPGTAPDGKTFASEGGFEEWKVRKAPNVSIVKTAEAASVNAGQNVAFTVTVTNTGAAEATGVTISDPLPGGSGIDWAESPDNPNCSISGSPPTETLNCGPVTLAAVSGSISVRVQSATTAASCGTYNNTATFTSTNAGSGSDSDSIAVNCAAIQIRKESTKTGNPLVANAGAVFSVDGPDANTSPDFSVTDDTTAAAPDEDAQAGVICVSGLIPGAYTINETTPPTGYGGSTQTNVSATAANGTNCSTNRPTTANSAVFRNTPLGEFIINFNDLGSGETSAKIDCTGLTPSPDDTTASDYDDDTETYTNLPAGNPAIVYTCTISIDP